MQNPAVIFNPSLVRAHKTRAAAKFSAHDFLLREICDRLNDRLHDVARDFEHILVIGSHGLFSGNVTECAEAEVLPYAENSFDCIIAASSLHWVNDLPKTLVQMRKILKPDGLFLAIMPGGETLKELRHAFEQAELQVSGGISPRISPFIDVRDAGSLLQRAGFALPVVDSDRLDVRYEHPHKLLQDLRGMGESNALFSMQKTFTSRKIFDAMYAHYSKHYTGNDGRVCATFELVTLTAWKPDASQAKPAKRGSGQINLKDVL